MTDNQCPNCDGVNTRRETLQVYQEHVEEVRTCGECPTQFVVEYGSPRVKDVVTYDG